MVVQGSNAQAGLGSWTLQRHDAEAVTTVTITLILAAWAASGLDGGDASRIAGLATVRSTFAVVMGTSCVLGLLMSLRPRAPFAGGEGSGGMARSDGRGTDPTMGHLRPADVGHHPDCVRFEEHRIVLMGRRRCAGCTGLTLGSVLGFALVAILALDGLPQGQTARASIAALACLLVSLSVFEERARPWSVWAHVAATAGLIIGTLSIVALLMDSGALPGSIGIAYAFAILGLRMDMSNVGHRLVCEACGVACSNRPVPDGPDIPASPVETARAETSLQP